MKRLISTLTFVVFTFAVFSQTVDTIISTKIYKSYFSNQTHTPLFVAYKLYHGGGDCSRKGMNFSTDGLK